VTCGATSIFLLHLESERGVRRAVLVETLDSRRYFGLLAALERFAASPPPRRPRGDAAHPLPKVARRGVKRATRKVMERGDAVGEVPEAEDLHALRIRAKRLRYLLEALKPITGTPGKKLTKQLVRLQDVLGRFDDAIVAATFVRAYRDGPGSNAHDEERHTLTALADREMRRAGAAQSDFARAWRRFTGKDASQRQMPRNNSPRRAHMPTTGGAHRDTSWRWRILLSHGCADATAR
jgi:CHAD domain-containing protein